MFAAEWIFSDDLSGHGSSSLSFGLHDDAEARVVGLARLVVRPVAHDLRQQVGDGAGGVARARPPLMQGRLRPLLPDETK